MGDPNNAAGSPVDLSSAINVEEENSPTPLGADDGEFSANVLHYIDQMLMEEDMDEEKYSMFRDSLALQATEKSFYNVIGDKYPSSSSSSSSIQHHLHNVESPEDSVSRSFSSVNSSSTGSGSSTYYAIANNPSSGGDSAESQLSILDPNTQQYYNPSPMPTNFPFPFLPPNFVSHYNPTPTTQSYMSHFTTTINSGLLENTPSFFPSFNRPQQVVVKTEFDEEEEEEEKEQQQDYERRNNNNRYYSPVHDDGNDLSELFDKVLLGTRLGRGSLTNEESNWSRGGSGKRWIRKQDNYNEEFVDLRTLLIQCAQAVSCGNRLFANELLMQIKKHSSPTGDGTQRLAHCFANALEARMAGIGTHVYSALSSKKTTSPVDMIKAYQVYVSACPFEKLAIIYANDSIFKVAEGAETLHIVDFGIRYGFKWPALISRLSRRDGCPPKLRITGIEFPQPGLKLEETGHRLATYCKRFNVAFEFNPIVAKKWETIKVEDLNIKHNERVAVNCMFRFENLLDETVVSDNPRDAVLDLIRKANPNIFVHGIVNGSYDAAFFATRFKEALFHYSALFDMLDTNVGGDDPMRLVFEEEIFGREVVNVVACEGSERVVRPHTYKKWQLRNMRCGLRELPLDQRTLDKLKGWLRRDGYHRDFMLHVDGNWVLQGWKGRILHASSCWVPA